VTPGKGWHSLQARRQLRHDPARKPRQDAMRRSIYIDEFAHKSPIPNASRIGDIIVSGLLRGVDPQTQAFPPSVEQQCAFMFANVRRCVEAGGGTVEDIIKVTFWMKELQRKPVNDEWIKMFPDPASRPARQIMEVPMEPEVLVECEFMAVIEDGRGR
jgi:2-iminobutanoate/2-iminopropanoate deaminase